MEQNTAGALGASRVDDEKARYAKRIKLRQLNNTPSVQGRLILLNAHWSLT